MKHSQYFVSTRAFDANHAGAWYAQAEQRAASLEAAAAYAAATAANAIRNRQAAAFAVYELPSGGGYYELMSVKVDAAGGMSLVWYPDSDQQQQPEPAAAYFRTAIQNAAHAARRQR